jgi:hypothetical protein
MTHEQFLGQLARKPTPKINEKVLTEGGNDETIQELIDRDAREYANREIGTSPRMRDDWSETYDDFVENANQNKYLQYQKEADKLVRQGLADPAAAHSEYTLPGGENYREMLIKDPQGKFEGVPAHFHGEPNIIASMRLKDRTGPNGEKLLHLEELQSDWHQQGREHGYRQNLTELPEGYKVVPYTNISGVKDYHVLDKNGKVFAAGSIAETATKNALDNLNNGNRAPDAPFKKNWDEMAIKRLIHHAAEKGYHGIVVTPGQEQADRYSLAQHVDEISHYPRRNMLTGETSKGVRIDMKSGHGMELGLNQEGIVDNVNHGDYKNYKGKHISDIVGKEHAKNIMGNVRGQISGEGLTVGGEGMKGFYDKKVPNIFNTVGKKHGVTMELHKHQIEKEPANRLQVGEMVYEDPAKIAQLHHFPITEPMREDVLKNGLPLYKTGGVIHKAEGGNVQPSVEQMRMALQNKSTFPKYGIQSIGANEAPDLSPKYYIQPNRDGNLGVGGVDMDNITPGMQLVKQEIPNMNPPNSPNAQQAPQSPLGAPPSPQGGQSNILNMTPQGQALSAMTPPQQGMPQMARGGNVQGYASKGYVHHTDLYPHPEVGKRFKISGVGQGLAPINHVNVEDLMGGSFGVAPWDTSGSHVVEGVSGNDLINPVKLEAGQNFSRMLNNIKTGRGGASGRKVVEGQQDRITKAIIHNLENRGNGNVYTSPMTMNAMTSSNFSTMPIEIQLDLMHQAGLTQEELDTLSDEVRKEKGMENFVGFDDPNLWEHITKGDSRKVKSIANVRKAMTKVLASKENQHRLNYNFEDLVGAITDPDLRGAPMNHTGRILLKGNPEITPGDQFTDPNHTSYSTGHKQKFIGGSHNAPVELWMPDSFEQEKKRLLRKNPSLATNPNLRNQTINSLAWTKEPVGYQKINDRVVQNIKRFEEGQKAGDIDPNDLQGIFEYYKRKHGGFKKGGKVKESLDTMRYALTKTKKAK